MAAILGSHPHGRYLPWLDDQQRERFAYPEPFEDPDGLHELSDLSLPALGNLNAVLPMAHYFFTGQGRRRGHMGLVATV